MIIGHEKLPSCSALCIAFGEVRGVAMYNKNHVACLVCNDGIGVSCCIVQELFHFSIVFLVRFACWVMMDPRTASIMQSTVQV